MSLALLYLVPLAVAGYGAYEHTQAETEPQRAHANSLLVGGLAVTAAIAGVDQYTSAFAPLRYGESFRERLRHPYTDVRGRRHPRGLSERQIDRVAATNERFRLAKARGKIGK